MQVKKQVNSLGNKRIDYIFSFNDFSPGWTQEVFVELDKNYKAEIAGLNWIQNNKSSEKLDAKLHRDFHMGKMLNDINTWLALNATDEAVGMSKEKLLDLCKQYLDAYDHQGGWKSIDDWCFYAAGYFIEAHTDSKLPLHERIGNRLGIQKANSDHLLHRGKAKGYFKSFGQQRTLVPTRKIVNNMKEVLDV